MNNLFLGQEEINEALLVVFLRKHPNLKFLGLMSSDVCKSDIFSNPLNADYRPGLEVILMKNNTRYIII